MRELSEAENSPVTEKRDEILLTPVGERLEILPRQCDLEPVSRPADGQGLF